MTLLKLQGSHISIQWLQFEKHYMQKRAAKFYVNQGMFCKDKAAELKTIMSPKKNKKNKTQIGSVKKSSYIIENLIAKTAKPFPDDEIVRQI